MMLYLAFLFVAWFVRSVAILTMLACWTTGRIAVLGYRRVKEMLR